MVPPPATLLILLSAYALVVWSLFVRLFLPQYVPTMAGISAIAHCSTKNYMLPLVAHNTPWHIDCTNIYVSSVRALSTAAEGGSGGPDRPVNR